METTVTFRWFAPLFFMFCLALPLAAVKGGEKRPSHIGHRHIVNMPRGPRPGLPFTEVKKRGGKMRVGAIWMGPFFLFYLFCRLLWVGSILKCRPGRVLSECAVTSACALKQKCPARRFALTARSWSPLALTASVVALRGLAELQSKNKQTHRSTWTALCWPGLGAKDRSDFPIRKFYSSLRGGHSSVCSH